MELTAQDRIDITDLINRHGHLADDGDHTAMAALFTPDVDYVLPDRTLHGRTALAAAADARPDVQPAGHHVTNIVITGDGPDAARARSKGIGIRADGTAGTVGYDDVLTRGPDGWRISRRTVRLPRPRGARAVLERWQRASVDQDEATMRALYTEDAVHEFPFHRPGIPARLTGRDEILGFVTAFWTSSPVRYDEYRTLAVHDTPDPDTIVVDQEVDGRAPATGPFTLPNLLILTTRAGRISHVRDYVNLVAAADVIGT